MATLPENFHANFVLIFPGLLCGDVGVKALGLHYNEFRLCYWLRVAGRVMKA